MRSRRKERWNYEMQQGYYKGGCFACPFLTGSHNEVVQEVPIFSTGERVKVEGRLSCKTEGGYLLYLLWGKKAPEKQYLGSCGRQPMDIVGEHWRDILNGEDFLIF